MTALVFWTAVFGILGYFVATDPSIAKMTDLLSQHLLVEIKRRWMMFTLHPRNPIANYLFERRIKKLTKELVKEYNLPETEDE